MQFKLITVLLVGSLIVFTGCASEERPNLTPMQIQSLQTKQFDTTKPIAFASVISVFQDLGYIVNTADKDTGFITANSPSESHKDWFFTGNTYSNKTRATAFIEEIYEGNARIRLNFVVVNQTSTAYGQGSQEGEPILDASVYQKAFARIGEAIFARSAKTDMREG